MQIFQKVSSNSALAVDPIGVAVASALNEADLNEADLNEAVLNEAAVGDEAALNEREATRVQGPVAPAVEKKERLQFVRK